MDTKAIEALLAENEEALKTVEKALEGLSHMDEQDDLLESSREAVEDLGAKYETRRELHRFVMDWATGAKGAIDNLLADGYPEEPMGEVNRDVTEDIDQNFDTLKYARSRFKVRPLTTEGTFEAGEQHAP
jgi:hypothetical protein